MSQYNNPTPVAVGIVRIRTSDLSKRFLAIRRGIPPAKGGLALPGGYIDENESVEQAMARELREECGLQTSPSEWKLLTSRITPDNKLLLFCLHDRFVDESALRWLAGTDETDRIESFGVADTLCFPLHQDVAQKAFAGELFGL